MLDKIEEDILDFKITDRNNSPVSEDIKIQNNSFLKSPNNTKKMFKIMNKMQNKINYLQKENKDLYSRLSEITNYLKSVQVKGSNESIK